MCQERCYECGKPAVRRCDLCLSPICDGHTDNDLDICLWDAANWDTRQQDYLSYLEDKLGPRVD